jgi:hypothetical protein
VGIVVSRGIVQSMGGPTGPAGPPTPTHRHTSTAGVSAAAGDPLTGEWQSPALPAPYFRAAISAAGFSPSTARQVMTGARRWVVQMTFGTTLTVETWDPAEPSASLRLSTQYAFRVLPDHRLAVTAFGSGSRWSFSYQITGDRLRLRYSGASTDDLEAAGFAAWAAATPMRLVHY